MPSSNVARASPRRWLAHNGILVGVGGLATVPTVWLGLSAPAISPVAPAAKGLCLT